VSLWRNKYDLFVRGAVVGDVLDDVVSARMTVEGRCPYAFVSYRTFD